MISRNECDSYTCLSEKKVRMFAVCFWPLGTKISFILSKLKWLYSGFWTYSVNLGRSYSIEAWIPKGPLHACGVPHKVDNRNPQQSNSYLYNAMLHPLLRLSIKGVLWYQGETKYSQERLKKISFIKLIFIWGQYTVLYLEASVHVQALPNSVNPKLPISVKTL